MIIVIFQLGGGNPRERRRAKRLPSGGNGRNCLNQNFLSHQFKWLIKSKTIPSKIICKKLITQIIHSFGQLMRWKRNDGKTENSPRSEKPGCIPAKFDFRFPVFPALLILVPICWLCFKKLFFQHAFFHRKLICWC